MKLTRAIDVQSETVRKICDRVSALKHFKGTSAQLSKDTNKIFTQLPAKTPRHVTEYCRGYLACLRDQLFQTDLVYGGFVDGVFCTSDRAREDYYEKTGKRDGWLAFGHAKQLGFYWADNTSKPYFIPED